MIGGGVTAFRQDKNLQTRAYISLQEINHKKGELPLSDPNFRYTNFSYNIKYKPSANKGFKKKPYLILADVFTNTSNSYRVSDYKDFLESVNRSPEVKWFVENTTHSEELFELVKANPGIYFPIQFDVVKYAKKVMKNIGQENEPIGDVFLIQDIKEADRYRREEYLASYNKKEVKL